MLLLLSSNFLWTPEDFQQFFTHVTANRWEILLVFIKKIRISKKELCYSLIIKFKNLPGFNQLLLLFPCLPYTESVTRLIKGQPLHLWSDPCLPHQHHLLPLCHLLIMFQLRWPSRSTLNMCVHLTCFSHFQDHSRYYSLYLEGSFSWFLMCGLGQVA